MPSTAGQSRIVCDADFDKDGRQARYIRAPHSRNTSGWGVVEIPIIVVKNGRGPTILLTGGVHGDEYEGPIAISRLAQTLQPGDVQGRVIMMPAVNIPAVLGNTRLSPIDDRDINRCFPGNPRGTFSEMLAHFMDSVILPMADVSIDLHTAGHSCDSALSTNMHHVDDPDMLRRTMEAAAAFGAPYNVVFWGVDEGATFTFNGDPGLQIALHAVAANGVATAPWTSSIDGAFAWSSSDGRAGRCVVDLLASTDFADRERTITGEVCGHTIQQTVAW